VSFNVRSPRVYRKIFVALAALTFAVAQGAVIGSGVADDPRGARGVYLLVLCFVEAADISIFNLMMYRLRHSVARLREISTVNNTAANARSAAREAQQQQQQQQQQVHVDVASAPDDKDKDPEVSVSRSVSKVPAMQRQGSVRANPSEALERPMKQMTRFQVVANVATFAAIISQALDGIPDVRNASQPISQAKPEHFEFSLRLNYQVLQVCYAECFKPVMLVLRSFDFLDTHVRSVMVRSVQTVCALVMLWYSYMPISLLWAKAHRFSLSEMVNAGSSSPPGSPLSINGKVPTSKRTSAFLLESGGSNLTTPTGASNARAVQFAAFGSGNTISTIDPSSSTDDPALTTMTTMRTATLESAAFGSNDALVVDGGSDNNQ